MTYECVVMALSPSDSNVGTSVADNGCGLLNISPKSTHSRPKAGVSSRNAHSYDSASI